MGHSIQIIPGLLANVRGVRQRSEKKWNISVARSTNQESKSDVFQTPGDKEGKDISL